MTLRQAQGERIGAKLANSACRLNICPGYTRNSDRQTFKVQKY